MGKSTESRKSEKIYSLKEIYKMQIHELANKIFLVDQN